MLILIKKKLLLLYALNISDIVLTLILLDSGICREANIIMSLTISNRLATFLLKIVLPSILLIAIYFRIQSATLLQLKKSNQIVNVAIAGYTLINFSHLVWFAMLPEML